VNIGFAAPTMNKDIGLSSYVFGLGAGAFFWGYFILEVPSNLILEKVGARRWIGRIRTTGATHLLFFRLASRSPYEPGRGNDNFDEMIWRDADLIKQGSN
jgi:hypothetical protein